MSSTCSILQKPLKSTFKNHHSTKIITFIMENSPYIISAPLLLRNIFLTLYVYLDKFILYFTGSYKLLKLTRQIFLTLFLFFLRILPSFNPEDQQHGSNPSETDPYVPLCNVEGAGNDLCVSRALSQILSIINNIPVTSRKYEAIRALAEKLIDENHKVGSKALREVNRDVLATAFARTLGQYEKAVKDEISCSEGDCAVEGLRGSCMQIVKFVLGRVQKGVIRPGNSAEKLVAEMLWLAQKLAVCGCAGEAVRRWASASNLARLSVVMEPRLQGSLLKVSAFLLKQSRELWEDEMDLSKMDHQRKMKMDMLMSWLPFLCRAQNGTEAPILSISERVELEKILEETIDELDSEVQQEKVLSLWLHHFMYCPSSDWPNLQHSYTRWFSASRKLLI